MDKITFEGKEYKDMLTCRTVVHVSFWQRLKNLFCPDIEFKLEIYTEEPMPNYHVARYIRSISYWKRWKTLYRVYKYKNKGLMQAGDELK